MMIRNLKSVIVTYLYKKVIKNVNHWNNPPDLSVMRPWYFSRNLPESKPPNWRVVISRISDPSGNVVCHPVESIGLPFSRAFYNATFQSQKVKRV